ncbi:hypothetical protein [Pendulispora albinea]|uniref:Uncharacterized protein n=1 Tax=Pendulispora albinea TaxID=2741071 RepID=A0ABZ2M000_9BACT
MRTVIAIVVAFAAWSIAPSAFASSSGSQPASPNSAEQVREVRAGSSAPQCDQRGATTFAPTPTLDPPNASIDVGDADDSDCRRLLGWAAFEQGHTPAPCSCHAIAEAILTARLPVRAADFVGFVVTPAAADDEHRGVRHQVERPPRAS